MTNYRKKYKTKSKLATDKIKEQEKEIDKLVYVVGEQKKQLEELQAKLDAAATGQQYQGDVAEDMQEKIEKLEEKLMDECMKTTKQLITIERQKFNHNRDVDHLIAAIEIMTRREKNK